MGVITNVQAIVIVNRSLDWTSYTDCSVTSVAHLCLLTAYSYVSVDFCYCNIKTCTVAKYLRIVFEASTD